jgi:hypothetical protein
MDRANHSFRSFVRVNEAAIAKGGREITRVAGVNYPGGRATTILAGWRREFDSGGWVRESLSLVSFLRLLASEARQAGGVGRGAVVKPRTPSGAVHRLVLWAGGLSTAGAV